jgi:predicted ATPase
VGKTRLAIEVAADIASRYAHGTWYVDLVPVTDPSMVGAAAAGAFGFGEQLGRSPTDTVVAKLAGAEALVVLDNCEHLADAVTGFVERLLTGCPRTTVLATSRAAMRLPFEYVYRVPGLSLDHGASDGGDAVALFVERAAMAGWTSPYPHDRDRIAAICGELDCVALAIELAAARLATLGLDGLESGLADRLALLTAGARLDDRHQSVRSALDWSFGLLGEKDQVVLRRASVFVSPFTSAAAAEVTGHPPLMPGEVAGGLARLAEHNLLVVTTGSGGTRYRMLETIRQYGAEQMVDAGEETRVRERHLRWCRAIANRLEGEGGTVAGFDEVADDLRAGLGWAAGQREHRAEAHALAVRLARLTYARGRPSEAQERYEEAAALASDPDDAAEALHLAAAVAWGRHAGNEAIRLYRSAAGAARRAGDPHRAAVELVNAAEILAYAPGILSELAPSGEDHALVAEARVLGGGDAHAEAAVLAVTAVQGELLDPATLELTERVVELAHRVGDARLESAALDELTAVRLAYGELDGAAAAARRRLELLTPLADDVEMAWEYSDALHMAPMVYLAAGDLEAARRYARARSELPFFREAHHLALEWLLTTAAIAGDFDEAVELARRFRQGWVEAGRPPIGGIAFAPAAAAMVYGIRGDDKVRLEWLDILSEMRRVLDKLQDQPGYSRVFQALVALHRGRLGDALTPLTDAPETLKHGYDGAWRPWYAALWAEAAVLAALPDRRSRLDRASFVVRGNPIAAAIVERADAIDARDADRLLATATALDAAGCRYQQARTLVFAGGEARAEGEAMMAAIGATPMAT